MADGSIARDVVQAVTAALVLANGIVGAIFYRKQRRRTWRLEARQTFTASAVDQVKAVLLKNASPVPWDTPPAGTPASSSGPFDTYASAKPATSNVFEKATGKPKP